MTSIRSILETHAPLVLRAGPESTTSYIEIDDLVEMQNLAGYQIPSSSGMVPGHALVETEAIQTLFEAAHLAVHPPQPMDRDGLMSAIFDGPQENTDQGGPEEPQESIDYNVLQRRLNAAQFAVSYSTTKLQAEHGLDTTPVDVIELAKRFDDFLKG